ncbi:MAG: putative ATPase [Chthoniobacter sp.]|nr:putative ATPase [Chthoniobacter sp.]
MELSGEHPGQPDPSQAFLSIAGGPRVKRCFLFTDVEGSTELWGKAEDAFRSALDLHHAVIRKEIVGHGGQELSEAGDGFLIVFESARQAVTCAVSIQQKLRQCRWPRKLPAMRVRMGLHAGEAELREDGEYRGVSLNRASRVCNAAHGDQMLCTNSVAEAVREAGVEASDLGLFRLKGLPEPERLHQVCWPGMPTEAFPPPNAPPAYTHNLPVAPTRFIGREKEIAAVREHLLPRRNARRKSGKRLVTLTGPGGTGKTRLALAVADSLLQDFSHAVWLVPLADVHDARLLGGAILAALRLQSEPGRSTVDSLLAHFAGQPALLVLDNFEQIADMGVEFVQRLLTRIPELRCVVTSRQRLKVPGEREFPVSPLAVPRAEGLLLQELQEIESVALYTDRARATRPDFELRERNAAAVAELCRRLDGMPLAIELAAARADVLTPAETIAELGSRLDALASSAPSTPQRHRTIRAAIDWSYEFFPPPLRIFFAGLSVFRGGWTSAAAEAVAALPGLEGVSSTVLRALAELRSGSLIVSTDDGETMRFSMLETLRHYAGERLDELAEATEIRNRFIEHMLRFGEKVEAHEREADQSVWLSQMDRELDNIRAALTLPDAAETRGQLAGTMTHYWQVRGLLSEGRGWVDSLLKDAAAMAPATIAGLHNTAGSLAVMMNDCAVARSHFEETLAYFRTTDDQRNIAGMLSNIGVTALGADQPDEARKFFEESLQAYEGLGLETRRALALGNLGCAWMEMGNFAAAEQALQSSVALQRELKDECGLASTLATLAEMELRRAEPDKAHALALQSVELSQRLRLLPYLTINATLLALAAAKKNELKVAASWIATADRLTENGAMMMISREMIGRVLQLRHHLESQLPKSAQREIRSAGTVRADRWLGEVSHEALDA